MGRKRRESLDKSDIFWGHAIDRLQRQKSQIDKLIEFLMRYEDAGIAWLMPKSIEKKLDRLNRHLPPRNKTNQSS